MRVAASRGGGDGSLENGSDDGMNAADGKVGMVIVGAGECGARAAFALRENGFSGPVTLVGEEPHLPYERPPLSKEALHHDEEPEPKWIGLAERFAEQSISVLTRRSAVAIDRDGKTVKLSDGSTLAYDKLLLATGALPRRLPLAADAGPRCVTLRSFDDALAIRKLLIPGMQLVVIGGGFIGLELAASAVKRGAAVTVIEALPRVLMRGVPEEIASVVTERHRAAGADIRADTGIAAISGDADAVRLTLADGSELAADLLVVGIGAAPVTGLAESAGLAIENGIAVDRFLRTSDPDIFAAGDCCSFPLGIYGGRRVRLESWRRRTCLRRAVVLVGSARPHAADRGPRRRGGPAHPPRSRGRRLHPVPPCSGRAAARRQRHRAGQCRGARHQACRDADRQGCSPRSGSACFA
jgi:3-phenylpropionate/trans-cinnamate dioxygenase ferredoxin reductase subunit